MMEVTEGSDSESKIIDPNYVPVMQKQSMKALFDRDIRHLWKNTGFYLLYGAESPWNLTYGAWYIEDKVKEMEYLNQNEGEFKINICAQEGANHFVSVNFEFKWVLLMASDGAIILLAANVGDSW